MHVARKENYLSVQYTENTSQTSYSNESNLLPKGDLRRLKTVAETAQNITARKVQETYESIALKPTQGDLDSVKDLNIVDVDSPRGDSVNQESDNDLKFNHLSALEPASDACSDMVELGGVTPSSAQHRQGTEKNSNQVSSFMEVPQMR